MMPAYRNMDSYPPFQRNQIPFPPQCYNPGPEAVIPQMIMDPSKAPFPFEQHWPYAGSYGHPMPPMPAHFCCGGHNNFPGYYSYRPSYPHAPDPSPMYYSGGYPAYGEQFFAPLPPRSHYTMELPRYEYDKYMPKDHHCCGCPNNPCYQKEGRSVKIEEHGPDVVKKENDAVVPVQLRNYPYPLVWIPPEYYGNRQLKNAPTAEVAQQDKMFHDKKPTGPENFNADAQPAQEPRVIWNGWLPFDMKGAPNMVHDGEGIRSQKRETDNNRRESEDGRMDQKHQSETKRSEFPFPIIWLPYYNKQEEGERTNNEKLNSTKECIEEVPHTLKSFPVKPLVDEGVTDRTKSNEVESKNTGSSDVIKETTNQRSIPVKQMDSHQGKNDSEKSEKGEMNVHVNKKEENVTKENSHSSSKRGSTSPRKLPPVCLRVDPIPRKKNGNGSSRSPSPPASKQHSQTAAGETNKTPSPGMNDKAKPDTDSKLQNTPNTGEKVEPKLRTIQVSENKTSENKGAEYNGESESQINMHSGVPTETREIYTDGDRYKAEDKKEEKGEENMTGEAAEHSVKVTSTPTDQGGKKELDADAAALIQAAYRGHQVRKWEPLKKLKQLDEVSKEVTDVRSHIQAFEGSPELQNDERQKIAIGETIMRLLLKLDTIQGLHPNLREIRKSLARELATLQERLDASMAKKPQQQMQEFDVQKPVEVTSLNSQNGISHQVQQEEKVAVPGDSSEGLNDGGHDTLETHHDQFCMKDGDNNVCPNDGGSESQSPVDPPSNEGTEPTVLPNGFVNEDISPVIAVDALDSTRNPFENDEKAVECVAKSEGNDIPIKVDKLDMIALKELPVGIIDEEVMDVGSENKQKDGLDSDIHAMMELPVGVLDEDKETSEFRKDGETNISKGEVQAENQEFIEELPVGLLDEETAYSEVLSTEGEEGDANEREGSVSSIDVTANETQQEQPLLEEQGDAPPGMEESLEAIENEAELPSQTTQVSDSVQGEEETCLETNDAANILSEEPMELVPINEKESQEKLAQQETQVDGQDTVEEAQIKKETELPADLAVAEHDGELTGDVKLLEENEKLRKLMKELLEAGNQQLSVISSLTGRVKDLEKKLARTRKSKRVRTKQYRRVSSKRSCSNSSE